MSYEIRGNVFARPGSSVECPGCHHRWLDSHMVADPAGSPLICIACHTKRMNAADALESFAKWCEPEVITESYTPSWMDATNRMFDELERVAREGEARFQKQCEAIAAKIRAPAIDATYNPNTKLIDVTCTVRPIVPAEFVPEVSFAPSLQDRYAAFRSAVERVVKEEAPNARVVTEQNAVRKSMGMTRPIFVAWVYLAGLDRPGVFECPTDEELDEEYFREWLVTDGLANLGARAMGRK